MIAPARTGRVRSRRRTVRTRDHTNNGIRSRRIPFHRILIMVVIKFTALMIDAAPAR